MPTCPFPWAWKFSRTCPCLCAGAGLVGTYYATKPLLRVSACQPRDTAHFLPKKANLRNIAQCIRLRLIPVSKARTHVWRVFERSNFGTLSNPSLFVGHLGNLQIIDLGNFGKKYPHSISKHLSRHIYWTTNPINNNWMPGMLARTQ